MNLTGAARVAGVMGWPVAHSRSPRLHGYWLARYGIDGAYVPMAVRPEAIGPALKALSTLGFAGTNLTSPHKESALEHLDRVDPLAVRLGAVNTIVVGEGGRLTGSNTDGFGFLENLRVGAPAWHAEGGPAAVLGAGGAARAIGAALIDAGAGEVRFINRTAARAEAVATALGGPCTVWPWSVRAAALEDCVLLVNTTTLGMAGRPPLDIVLDSLPPPAVVNDIVYTPLETPLLRAAAARGHPVVDGIGMLLHQARPGFEAWFGTAPEVTAELRAAVLAGPVP